MTQGTELLPCPMCGGSPLRGKVNARCNNEDCELGRSGWWFSPEAWNTRTQPAIPDDGKTVDIPVSAAKEVAKKYGYDQIIILGRKVGKDGREHVTTYGINRENCEVAARTGNFLKYRIMDWPELEPAIPEGFMLVPIEPTEAMLEAAQEAEGHHGEHEEWLEDNEWEVTHTYRAMIQAAQSADHVRDATKVIKVEKEEDV